MILKSEICKNAQKIGNGDYYVFAKASRAQGTSEFRSYAR
jgi:hypothetical protein